MDTSSGAVDRGLRGFGFSVGNLITLPSLIAQREFDARSVGVISLLTATTQVTNTFGPGMIDESALMRWLRITISPAAVNSSAMQP